MYNHAESLLRNSAGARPQECRARSGAKKNSPTQAASEVIIRSGMKWHCPICRKETDSETDAGFPFGCERCKLTDLGNWSSEKYVVSEPVTGESLAEKREQNRVKSERDDYEN